MSFVINRVTITLFSVLNRVSFWTGSLKQGVNVDGARSTCVVSTSFLNLEMKNKQKKNAEHKQDIILYFVHIVYFLSPVDCDHCPVYAWSRIFIALLSAVVLKRRCS